MMPINKLKIICLYVLKYRMARECQNKGLLSDISLIDSFTLQVFLFGLEGINNLT